MNTATRQESLAVQELQSHQIAEVPRQSASASALMMNDASMDKMIRLAEIMASGKSTIPAHLRGSVGDCMAVVMQATTWNMNPYAVAQKTHLVNGVLGYEAQLVAAVINNSGIVKDRFHFEWFGAWEKVIGKFEIKRGDKGEYRVPGWKLTDEEGCGIRVWATLKGETEPRTLELLLAQARVRNSTLWADDPKQQLAYLAQKRWSRLYAPDVILGVYTPDEFDTPAPRDMGAAQVVQPEIPESLLSAARAAAAAGVAAYQKFFTDAGPANRKLLADEHDKLKATAIAADKARTVDTPAAAPQAKPEVSPAGKPDADGVIQPAKTFDEVMAMLCAAKNVDALYVAADWIETIDGDDAKALLNGKFDERLAQVRGAA